MKQTLIGFIAAVLTVGLVAADAEAARRLGGGASSGMQRSQPAQRDAAPAQNTAPRQNPAQNPNTAPAPAAQPPGPGRWLAPLAGLAAGIGLAALFSHLGLDETLASILLLVLIAGAAVLVVRLLLRRAQPATARVQYAGGPAAYEPVAAGGAAPAARTVRHRGLADFDAESFVRHAKINFLRLQAANDAGNLEDLRAFTTPEMFAELSLRLQERAGAPQQTEVVTLDAELVELTTEFGQHIASVRFTGAIRENGGPAEPFDEIWHLARPVDDSRNWAIAGIQQAG